MQKLTITLLITLIGLTAYAQNTFVRMESTSSGLPLGIRYRLSDTESARLGNPFLMDEWQEITMLRRDSTVYNIPEGKYNVFVEALIAKIDDKEFYISEPRNIWKFELDGRQFEGMEFQGGRFGFFEVLAKGQKLVLLKKPECYIQSGTKSNGIISAKPDRYYQNNEYFVKVNRPNNSPIKIKVKGRKLRMESNLLPDFAKYLKDLDNRRFTEEEIVAVFKQYE